MCSMQAGNIGVIIEQFLPLVHWSTVCPWMNNRIFSANQCYSPVASPSLLWMVAQVCCLHSQSRVEELLFYKIDVLKVGAMKILDMTPYSLVDRHRYLPAPSQYKSHSSTMKMKAVSYSETVPIYQVHGFTCQKTVSLKFCFACI
jgi:hypothetical protein